MSFDAAQIRSNTIEKYVRQGLTAASFGVSLGFTAATASTRIGFGIARGITTRAVSIGSSLFDYAIGAEINTGEALNNAIIKGLEFAESLVLAPIHIGETIASGSLLAASSSLDVLASLLGSEEPSFTLGAFVQLVKREWNDPILAEHLPEQKFSLWDTTRALVVWASLQVVTREFGQRRLLSVLKEIPMVEWTPRQQEDVAKPLNEIHVTSSITLPEDSGELTTAEIGEPSESHSDSADHDPRPRYEDDYHLLNANLRRCSKLCLASYGGAGMIFFGIPMPTPASSSHAKEAPVPASEGHARHAAGRDDAVLAEVVQESEEAANASPLTRTPTHKFWDVVQGKHDREIFEGFAFKSETGAETPAAPTPTAIVGTDENMPRLWLLTDHGRQQVTLVLRGTMSFRELAIDLTCEAVNFKPGASSTTGVEPEPGHITSSTGTSYKVHSGIWQIAKEMGDEGRPLTHAVASALERNEGYELVMCGHSLGAGIVALLALMWADPVRCETIGFGDIPGGRRVSAYCFAPPCVTSPDLSKLCSSLVTSFVFSQDLVARLSLGSVRDLVRAAWWLCYGSNSADESCGAIMARVVAYQAGRGGTPEERENTLTQLLALRKTLEANMHMADLFPTGRVLLALRPSDVPLDMQEGPTSLNGLRIFEVKDVEVAFGQITFSRDMLSCHLPHRYDQILHDQV